MINREALKNLGLVVYIPKAKFVLGLDSLTGFAKRTFTYRLVAHTHMVRSCNILLCETHERNEGTDKASVRAT